MTSSPSPEAQRRAENADLRARLEEAEETLRAIRSGEVDSLVVETDEGPKIFSFDAAEAASNRFRGEVLAQIGDAVIAVDREDRITFFNAAAEREYGVRSDEVLGRESSEIYTRHWPRPDAEAGSWNVLREQGEWRGETVQRLHDGRELHVESSLTVLRAADGAYAGMVSAIRDITARKQLEAKLREREHFLQRLTDVTPGVLQVFDLEKQCNIFMNRTVASGLGYSAEEIAAMGDKVVPTLMHPDDLARFPAHLERGRMLRDDETADFEHRLRDRAGEWHWFHNRDAVFARDAAGAVRQLIGTANEITARKQAEVALRASEQFNRTVLESSPDCVKVLNAEGRLVFMNQNGQCLMEIDDFAALRGQPWWQLWPEAERAQVRAAVEKGLRGEVARFVAPGLTCKGNPRCWDVIVAPVVPAGGEGVVTSLISVSRDITESKAAEESLRRAAEELARSARAKDDFLAALSHELRTPLTPVLMTATALEGDMALPPEVREQLSMMRRNIELEARLIDDLLDITRISSGKLTIASVPADLHLLLDHTSEIVRSDGLGKQVRVAFMLDAARHHALADPTRLQQVFWNLLKNALKFTPAGGTITVRTRNDDEGWIAVSVEDTGIGIAANALPHIFKAFEQGDIAGQHRYGGLGLGLAISRAIVEAHGGTIQADSKGAGLGATFTVILARIDAPAEVPPATTPPSAPAPALRLLVVEDHEATRSVLERLLTRSGHLVTTASTVQDALGAYKAARFDAVISDLGLPDGSGIELMVQIQRIRPVPAIALSGYGMEDDLQRSKEAGCFAHLVKPVNFDQLRQLLDQLATRV